MNIIIADDHAIFRSTLTFLIANKTAHKVLAELEKIDDIAPAIKRSLPDLLLMDYHMPGGDALATAEYIKSRHDSLKIVFLTGTQSGFILKHLVQSEVDGILHKTDDAPTILAGLEDALNGKRVITQAIQERIAHDNIDLTNREFQVLCLIMKGKSSAEIGEVINIASRTVDKHKENIMKKANVSNVIQLVELGHRLQIQDLTL